jgi:hypothetical protein
MVIKPWFDRAGDFGDNGLAAVKLDGKWGYINETGDFVIEPQFDDADSFAVLNKKDIEERCIPEKKVNAKIAELEKDLATQRVIYAENAGKIFGAGAKLKKIAKARISRLEAEIFYLKKSLK